jgi:hypothetical protein
MVRLLLFAADTVLNNRNKSARTTRARAHTYTHTHKPDYSTQSKFFVVLRTVGYAFSSTTTVYIRHTEHAVLYYTDIFTVVASNKLQRKYVCKACIHWFETMYEVWL